MQQTTIRPIQRVGGQQGRMNEPAADGGQLAVVVYAIVVIAVALGSFAHMWLKIWL